MAHVKITMPEVTGTKDTPASGYRSLYPTVNGWGDTDDSGNDYHLMTESGWIPVSETWTYASGAGNNDGSVTVLTAAEDRYQVGDRVRFKQGGSFKYCYIRYVADTTTLELATGDTYTLADASITDVYVSRISNPFGFPEWLTWVPTITGFSSLPTTNVYKFKMVGKTAYAYFSNGGDGTSNSTSFTFTLPITSSDDTGYASCAPCQCVDNGSYTSSPGMFLVGNGSFSVSVYINFAAGAFTASSGKRARGILVYEAKE